MGQVLAALGALALIAGAGLIAYGMAHGGGAGSIIPDLGALTSNMKIDGAGGDRTSIASKGDIRFDPLQAKAEAKKEEPKTEDKTAEKPAEAPAPGVPDGSAAVRDRLAHDLSGAKLTTNLGGDFGAKNIFGGAGSPNAPKFNTGMAKANLSIPKAQNGKISAMKSNKSVARGSKLNVNRAKTQRAFGQLLVSRGLSTSGAGMSSVDAAHKASDDAFNQTASNGGEIAGPGGIGTGPASTPSGPGGAPDVTSIPTVPDVTPGYGDPRMDQAFKGIEQLASAAAKMKQMGMMLIALGVILEALAATLLSNPFTSFIGLAILAISIMLVAMGIMMMKQAASMAAMAKQMGQQLSQAYGTGTYQSDQVNACTDQVLDQGGGPCTHEPYHPAETTVQQDVEAERNTPVTIESGGGN
jgi:hypothetical protein